MFFFSTWHVPFFFRHVSPIHHAMLFTVLWLLLGLFCFWLFFKSVEYFEKI